jgi:hypothetical protein
VIFTPALLETVVTLPLFQNQSFNRFGSAVGNKTRHDFMLLIINLCKIWTTVMPELRQPQFIITQLACNDQTIMDNYVISCRHTCTCHINIYITYRDSVRSQKSICVSPFSSKKRRGGKKLYKMAKYSHYSKILISYPNILFYIS